MAWYPTLEGPALDAYRKMVSSLVAKASTELNLGMDELVVRDLRPEDIGASSADFYWGLDAAAWSTPISAQTIADNRFVGINGVALFGYRDQTSVGGSAVVSQIRVTRKGSVARYWVTKPVNSFENKVGYCDDPVTVDQNTTITVELWSRLAATVSNFTLLGAVVEKRGILISP